MIGKGKSLAHTSIAIDYARLKETGEELGRQHLAGETGAEIAQEFRMCQDLNGRCENNTLQFIISPTIEEGQKLSNQDLKEIYTDFIKKMGLEENQNIAFAHRDTRHTHIHVYANRIDFEGKAFNDAFISNKSARIAEIIAQERGMTTARDMQAVNLEASKTIREEIKHRHTVTMQHKPRDMQDYIQLMKANKVEVEIVTSKTGKVSGLRMSFEGQTFKASDIDRKMSFQGIQNQVGKQLGPTIAENVNLGLKIAKKAINVATKVINSGMGV